MFRARLFLPVFSFVSALLVASNAFAQFPVITAEDVKSRLQGKPKIMLVDTRTPEEYAEAHIPGAVNIAAERMKLEAARLPKDKSTPIIFYCRGTG